MNKIKNITEKVKRHALSLVLSPFTVRESKKTFTATLDSARRLFGEKLPSYRYSKYLMPEWLDNTRSIEAYFRKGLSFSFLGNKVIKQTMFVSTPKIWKDLQKAFVVRFFGKKEAKRLMRERSVGRPMLNDVSSISSGNTIHHLYHLAKFATETGTDLKSLKTIVELGGGYGNFARLCREIRPDVTYAIIDIPVFSYIQMVYLRTIFGDKAVHLVEEGSKVVMGKINLIPIDETTAPMLSGMFPNVDLFVSTWALSESNEETQNLLRNGGYFGAKHLLLAYQKSNSSFAFAEKIRDMHTDYRETFSAETDYLKDNFYLFAERR